MCFKEDKHTVAWLTWSAQKTDLTLRETNKCPESSSWWLLILWSCIPSTVRQSKEIVMNCVSCSRFVQPVSQLLYISTLHQNPCWITKKRTIPKQYQCRFILNYSHWCSWWFTLCQFILIEEIIYIPSTDCKVLTFEKH